MVQSTEAGDYLDFKASPGYRTTTASSEKSFKYHADVDVDSLLAK